MILNVASSSLVDQPSKESMTHFSGGVTSTLMKKTPHCNYRRHVILSLFEGTLQLRDTSVIIGSIPIISWRHGMSHPKG